MYLNQEWDKAIKAFKDSDKLEDMSEIRHTNPSRTYIKICSEFKQNTWFAFVTPLYITFDYYPI